MISIDDALKTSLRKMTVNVSFSQVSAAALCTDAHVSRAAFYSRYSSKDALLAALLYDDICAPVLAIRTAIPTRKYGESAHSLIDDVQCDNILANKAFYRSLVVDVPQLFVGKLTEGLCTVNKSILASYEDLSATEKDYMAFFYASSHTMLYLKWIRDDFKVPPAQLCDWYYKWGAKTWMDAAAARFKPKTD